MLIKKLEDDLMAPSVLLSTRATTHNVVTSAPLSTFSEVVPKIFIHKTGMLVPSIYLEMGDSGH